MSQTAPIPPTLVRVCPVCASERADEYLSKAELHLVRCPDCRMVYANPVGAEFASGSYYDKEAAEYYLSPAKLESDYAAVRFERELLCFRQHCPRGRVLDVGCSSGGFLYQLQTQFSGCYKILGTDVSGPALDYAEKRGIPIVRGDYPSLEFGEQKFDAVTFWAVLEHLMNPGAFLEKALGLLGDKGFCFVLVPNMRSLAARMLGARYRYIYPQHLNYFTRATLGALARRRFDIVEVRSTHFNPVVIWQDWRGGGAEISNQERAKLLRRTTAYKQNPLLRPARVMYGFIEKILGKLNLADNLLVVLQKPSARGPGA